MNRAERATRERCGLLTIAGFTSTMKAPSVASEAVSPVGTGEPIQSLKRPPITSRFSCEASREIGGFFCLEPEPEECRTVFHKDSRSGSKSSLGDCDEITCST